MQFNLWYSEAEEKELEKKRKQDFQNIGEKVYSFFLDTAIQNGYEEREGQWDMSCEITDAMKNHQHILVEAGVGIGKTFAYIVPLLFYHQKYKKPIVIATSTIALQEQLAEDIEAVENIINYYPDIIIAKGQNHFLCKYRCDDEILGKNSQIAPRVYEEIDEGACQRSDFDFNISDNLWNKINVKDYNPKFCRNYCVHKDYCFYNNLRQELLCTNGIILCNQDLLTVNLKKRCSRLREIITDQFQVVVIDEAHNLESKVRNSYTIETDYISLQRTMQQAKKIVRGFGNTIEEKIDEYNKCLDEVFKSLLLQIKRQDKEAEKENYQIERYHVDRNVLAIEEVKNCVEDIILEASMQFGRDDTYWEIDNDFELEKMEEQKSFWESILEKNSETKIFNVKNGQVF